jgi:hypothetical protein
VVICTPFQFFDVSLYHDSKVEEVLKEPFNTLYPSCHNESDDVFENIYEFIHVGRRKLDVMIHDGDPIDNIEGHFRLLSLQQPYMITNGSDIWKHEDVMIIDLF